jgi:RNA polymerase sigma factor (sigma-70 family)
MCGTLEGAPVAMTNQSDEFLPTRLSLLGRLKDWADQRSWQEFFDTYHRLIHRVALKAGLTESEAQDVVQETVVAVVQHIAEFRADPARGSFKACLLQIARRRIADQFEKRSRDTRLAAALPPATDVRPRPRGPDDSTRTATLDRVPDPAGVELEHHWEEEWQKHVLEAATARVKAQVTAKQFQIFELYVLRGWPVVKVTRTLDVSIASVYLARHRVGSLLRKEVRRVEAGGHR